MEQLALKLRRWWGIDNYSPVDIGRDRKFNINLAGYG